jgi:hypothetical protein
MLTAPIPAVRRALEKTGMKIDQFAAIEINEAFASVVLAWAKELHPDMAVVNPNGGAIALGHPIGATGTRLMTTLLSELERTGGRYGLQTMCEGGGQANVTILERLDLALRVHRRTGERPAAARVPGRSAAPEQCAWRWRANSVTTQAGSDWQRAAGLRRSFQAYSGLGLDAVELVALAEAMGSRSCARRSSRRSASPRRRCSPPGARAAQRYLAPIAGARRARRRPPSSAAHDGVALERRTATPC